LKGKDIMASIEEIKAALLGQKEKSKSNNNRQSSGGGDNASYAFWNIPEDTSATVRFLPDRDPDNTFFWVKREVIKLPFQGVEGGDYPTDREVTVQVPCVEMWGMTCPIISATRPWWKDPAKESLARTYWKKKSFIFQGFVVNSPFEEKETPENPIRRFVINPSIYEIIEKSLINPEMEDMPTDYVGGRDFKIAKTRKGEYANYGTSSWSMKVRSLTETEQTAIAEHGLYDLKEYLGRKPDADELAALKAAFEASVAGEPFDMASFGQYWRPYGNRDDAAPKGAARSTPAPKAAAAPVAESAPVSPAPAAASAGKPNPQDILERLRQRSTK